MKLIRSYIEDIDGIGIFPTLGFLLFLIVFAVAIYYFFTADKQHLAKMGEFPLEENKTNNLNDKTDGN